MSEIRYINTTKADMEPLMQVRLEMLRKVNNLSDEYVYDETFVAESRKYFENGNQTTWIYNQASVKFDTCLVIYLYYKSEYGK